MVILCHIDSFDALRAYFISGWIYQTSSSSWTFVTWICSHFISCPRERFKMKFLWAQLWKSFLMLSLALSLAHTQAHTHTHAHARTFSYLFLWWQETIPKHMDWNGIFSLSHLPPSLPFPSLSLSLSPYHSQKFTSYFPAFVPNNSSLLWYKVITFHRSRRHQPHLPYNQFMVEKLM